MNYSSCANVSKSLLKAGFSKACLFSAILPLLLATHTTASAQIVTGSQLQLWLTSGTGVTTDGSGNVSSWADQSGNGRNAGQGTSGQRPAYVTTGTTSTTPTGQASVSFDGSNDYLLGGMGTLTYTDIFVVGRLNSTGTQANDGIFVMNNGVNPDYAGGNDVLAWAAGDVGGGVPSGADSRWNGTGAGDAVGGALTLNTWYVYEYRVVDAGGGNVTLSISYRGLSDPSFVLLGSHTFTASSAAVLTQYALGTRLLPTPSGNNAAVDIASVLVYDGALSSGDQTQVRNTLYNQYLSVPEPQTWALAALGASAVLFRLRRKVRVA